MRQFQPGHARHGIVGDHKVEGFARVQEGQSLRSVHGAGGLMPHILQNGGHPQRHQDVVLDQENPVGA